MGRQPKKGAPPPPDGEPGPAAEDPDAPSKSTVSDVQDPLIPGDSGKRQKRSEANEASVDEAGQVTRKQPPIDLLH